MPELPTGTVTFLFSDIEGSSQLWEQHPEAMQVALKGHDALMREAISAHGGRVFKTVGDAFCAAFAVAPDALAAAAAIQRALSQPSLLPLPLRVRLALHAGTAEIRDQDYFGRSLNRVARLLAAGHGGQILLSASAQELVRDDLPEEMVLRDLGEHRLKDLQRPEQIYQVVIPDLAVDFPALKTLDARPNNLPVQATPFIGREAEFAVARERLLQEGARLLTLTGPGGIGKTRLALQLAADLLDEFPDGVFFVALAALSDPNLVLPTIAQTLGVRDVPAVPTGERLKEQLRQKHILLVLDNFEQVLAAAPLIGELLEACSRIRVLVTSRAVLRVYGEREFPVPPLTLPDATVRASRQPDLASTLTQYQAVRLFIERASDINPDFRVTNETAPVIAEICVRLDGLPLAIELAAARVRLLSLQALLARLEQRLRLLTTGARNLPARQQTLRDTIAWSYDLLNEPEKSLFRRLSAFMGGCTLEAAEGVGNPEGDPELDVLEGIEGLVAQSLLYQRESPDGEPRFVMLETLREYGLEQLAAAGDTEWVQARHAAYYQQLAETAGRELQGRDQVLWLGRLDEEYDNLRTAMRYLREKGGAEEALSLASALGWFWALRGYHREGREWFRQLLRTDSETAGPRTRVRAKALEVAGTLAIHQGDFDQGRRQFDESMAIAQELGDRGGIAQARFAQGYLAFLQGDRPTAETVFGEAMTLTREVNDLYHLTWTLIMLARLSSLQEDFATARARSTEGLALARQCGDGQAIAYALFGVGLGALVKGDVAGAQSMLSESLTHLRDLNDRWGGPVALTGLAGVAAAQSRSERALRLAGAADALREAIGVPRSPMDQNMLDRILHQVEPTLDEEARAAAWERGRSMSWPQAVEYALRAGSEG